VPKKLARRRLLSIQTERPDERERQVVARAETMLALAPFVGVNLDVLAFVAHRFELRLGVLDAAEPAPRMDLERRAAEDFEELVAALKLLAAALERGGDA
jgi:hypothetical protein